MGEGDYIPIATAVTTKMTPVSALRWAVTYESRFNVSLIVRDNITRQCPQTTIFEEKREPKRIQTEVSCLPA